MLIAVLLSFLFATGDIIITREQILEALSSGQVVIPSDSAPEDPPDPPEEPEPPPPPPPLLTSVKYGEITVTFDGEVEVYTSISGQPVVRSPHGGPLRVVSYSPAWDGKSNGAHLNPRYDHGVQSLTALGPRYSPKYQAFVPFTLKPGDKVLIASTRTEADVDGKRVHKKTFGIAPVLKSVFPLVVLTAPPPADFFRPGLAADGDRSFLTWSDVRFDLVDRIRLQSPPTGPPNVASIVSRLSLPWASYTGFVESNGEYTTWQTSYLATLESYYGRDRNKLASDAILATLLDIPSEEKKALLAVYLQQAIDFLSIARTGSASNPVRWGHSRGGIAAGPAQLLFFLGVLAERPDVVELIAGNRDLAQEFSQTLVLTSDVLERGYVNKFNGSQYRSPVEVGDVVWADTTVPPHRMNGTNWEDYRICCSANGWAWALAVILYEKFAPELGPLRSMVGHDPFFDYLDDWEVESKRLKLPDWQWLDSEFARGMWEKYRGLGPPRFVQPSKR